VTAVAGTGWPAYARVLHPLDDAPGARRWSDVARDHGRVMRAAVQWWEIADDEGPLQATGRSYPGDPTEGSLRPTALAALCGVLAGRTSTPERCWFAVWNGWGWWQDRSATAFITARSVTASQEPTTASAMLAALGATGTVCPSGPRGETQARDDTGHVAGWLDLPAPVFELPGREYLLYAGPIEAALSIGWWITPTWFQPQSPSLMWPDDHAWCVATEIDFDSTLIAGNPETITAVVADPHLEAWQIDPQSTWQHPPTPTAGSSGSN
jgi:hypothetical protein